MNLYLFIVSFLLTITNSFSSTHENSENLNEIARSLVKIEKYDNSSLRGLDFSNETKKAHRRNMCKNYPNLKMCQKRRHKSIFKKIWRNVKNMIGIENPRRLSFYYYSGWYSSYYYYSGWYSSYYYSGWYSSYYYYSGGYSNYYYSNYLYLPYSNYWYYYDRYNGGGDWWFANDSEIKKLSWLLGITSVFLMLLY